METVGCSFGNPLLLHLSSFEVHAEDHRWDLKLPLTSEVRSTVEVLVLWQHGILTVPPPSQLCSMKRSSMSPAGQINGAAANVDDCR